MANGVRKRCVECKAVYNGTQGRYESCPKCGGEMVAIAYRTNRRKRAPRT